MTLRDLPTIWVCKSVYWVLRKTGHHGAALPGLIAEKINPGLLGMLQNLPEGIIVISGTNGKTTTTHLTAEVLKRAGKRVFTNHSGSNMTRGLLASIVRFSKLNGKLPYDVAVLEIDEAYAAKLAPILKPKACILTNVLRDQLDRFGEIDHTAKLLQTLAAHCTDIVVYNICDPRLENLKAHGTQNLVSYGYQQSLSEHFPNDDDWHNKQKKTVIKEAIYTLVSLGEKTYISTPAGKMELDTSLLPGSHNALNLAAVVALLGELYKGRSHNFNLLRPPYGRGEIVMIGGKKLTLQLVKNPAGFNIAMDTHPKSPALIVVNDAIADSRDVSWLWDIDVQPLASRPTIYTAGTRTYDIANRLKYADIHAGSIELDIEKALRKFISDTSGGVVFLTYTAMLQTRKILHRIHREAKQ